jgi:hypothetical protein
MLAQFIIPSSSRSIRDLCTSRPRMGCPIDIQLETSMYRSFLTIMLVLFFPGVSKSADEYLIHIERAGYQDVAVQDVQPSDEVLNSLQFIIRKGVPFKGRTSIKHDVLAIAGELNSTPEGQLTLSIQYDLKMEDRTSAVTRNGFEIPGQSTRAGKTQVNLKLGQRLTISELINRRTRGPAGVETVTKMVVTVRITEFDPSVETPEEAEVSDRARLCHGWKTVEVTQRGKLTLVQSKRISLYFTQNLLFVGGVELDRKEQIYEYRLDTTTTPKRIVFTAMNGKFEGRSATSLYEVGGTDVRLSLPNFENSEILQNLDSDLTSMQTIIRLE